jgi:hypothetical protein
MPGKMSDLRPRTRRPPGLCSDASPHCGTRTTASCLCKRSLLAGTCRCPGSTLHRASRCKPRGSAPHRHYASSVAAVTLLFTACDLPQPNRSSPPFSCGSHPPPLPSLHPYRPPAETSPSAQAASFLPRNRSRTPCPLPATLISGTRP